jgi:hypothetical protein
VNTSSNRSSSKTSNKAPRRNSKLKLKKNQKSIEKPSLKNTNASIRYKQLGKKREDKSKLPV